MEEEESLSKVHWTLSAVGVSKLLTGLHLCLLLSHSHCQGVEQFFTNARPGWNQSGCD